MPTVIRTPKELEKLLKEQLDLLKSSCLAFDNGSIVEAKRLAASARVLVHDTKKSHSLLTLTNKKTEKFFDSADSYDDESVLSHSSLVQMHMTETGPKPLPHLDDALNPSWGSFDKWWNGIVLVDTERNEFSRKDIVLHLANKEGGSHVDLKIEKKYHDLQVNNSLGWSTVFEGGKEIAGEDQVPVTMRQIAHELIKSLEPDYCLERSVESSTAFIVRGTNLKAGVHEPEALVPNLQTNRPLVNGKKIGRNDPCTCGSGKKYKKCCI